MKSQFKQAAVFAALFSVQSFCAAGSGSHRAISTLGPANDWSVTQQSRLQNMFSSVLPLYGHLTELKQETFCDQQFQHDLVDSGLELAQEVRAGHARDIAPHRNSFYPGLSTFDFVYPIEDDYYFLTENIQAFSPIVTCLRSRLVPEQTHVNRGILEFSTASLPLYQINETTDIVVITDEALSSSDDDKPYVEVDLTFAVPELYEGWKGRSARLMLGLYYLNQYGEWELAKSVDLDPTLLDKVTSTNLFHSEWRRVVLGSEIPRSTLVQAKISHKNNFINLVDMAGGMNSYFYFYMGHVGIGAPEGIVASFPLLIKNMSLWAETCVPDLIGGGCKK